ncbi:MAG: hypothetical protein ACKVP3_18400 [Hyphomicrobiaceae bacterium]
MAVVAVDTVTEKPGFVSWGAAIAGSLLASALSFVLLTFGSAVGLSLVSPWTSTASSAKWAGALAVFWIIAQQIGSFLAGGYVAGRLRSRWAEAKPDEIEFRDGIHGALVWAIGIVVGAMLAASVAGSVASTATSAIGHVAGAAASQADSLSYQVDVLMRPAGQTPAGATAAPSDPNATKTEVLRIFATATARGELSPADKTYLAQLVAQRTGLPPQEAEARVTQVYNEAARVTKEAADKARKTAVATGFLTAASLLLSLAAAWWGAQRGGHHRDTSRPARFF